jgi:transposase
MMMCAMEEIDARKLNQDAQEELRRQAIRGLKQGKTQTQVARETGVHQPTVNRWWKRYQQGGWDAVRKRKRGRRVGTDRKLTEDQEREIQKVIVDKTPDQLKMAFALWNREAVRQLIHERFGVEYGLQTMSTVLRRWGFTPQRPLKRAYEQRPEAVKEWMEEEYPQIKERAKEQNAEIWWGDETAVKPECHYRRSYAPKGKTPVVRQPAKRFHSSLISAINNQGKINWMPLREAINADTFVKFLKQLIKKRTRKIILIVDNLKVHHSYVVRDWLKGKEERIELVYLPSYSPELNPDAYLNNHLKQTVTAEEIPRDKADLDGLVELAMLLIAPCRDLIKSFFHHHKVRYASL